MHFDFADLITYHEELIVAPLCTENFMQNLDPFLDLFVVVAFHSPTDPVQNLFEPARPPTPHMTNFAFL